MVDAGYDFAFFGVRVGGDGEVQAFNGCMVGFGGRCTGERDSGWVSIGFGLGVDGLSESGGRIHERNSGGTELCLGRDNFDVITEDGGVGFDGRHAVMVWRCW